MSKNFINFHVLISHSPSCLNRDDMNLQKTAIFGGTRRVRISSQSLKRSMRISDYYAANLGVPSTRTRRLDDLLEKFATALDGRYTHDQVAQAIALIADKKDGISAGLEASAVAPWAAEEVARVCDLLANVGDDEKDIKKLSKAIAKDGQNFTDALNHAVDIALSGRMATSGLMTSIDGAMSVAHAITTHKVDSDIDWFTAVDDLTVEANEVGAGHLNSQEFSSGVFYRYASLNVAQLQKNLGDCSRDKALEIAAHVAYLLATVVPSAKQTSTAAYNLADLAMVSFSDQPISLANAFEAPIQSAQKGGFSAPSKESLMQYWCNIHKGYGLDENVAGFVLQGDLTDGVSQCESLPDLQAWVRSDGNAS